MLNPILILYGIITGLILGFLRIDVHLVPYLVAAFVFGYLIHTLVMYFEKDISNKKYSNKNIIYQYIIITYLVNKLYIFKQLTNNLCM